MPEEKKWQGRSKGGITGLRIFVFTLNTFGLRTCYFFIRFVAIYFLIFSRSTRHILNYFKIVHGQTTLQALASCVRNYFVFGQILIDKIAIYSHSKNKLTFEKEGFNENILSASEHNRGGILLSAHMGNWEIAGHKLGAFDIKFNILMFDNEVAPMKDYMTSVTGQKKYNIIAIKEDMSHLVELHRAFNDKELLVMHGDRFLPNTDTVTRPFFGRLAKFPAGPFLMASRFGVPITPVFAFKDSKTQYHFYAKKAITVKRSRKKEQEAEYIAAAADEYIAHLEEMVRKYPDQWFNFYEFWE